MNKIRKSITTGALVRSEQLANSLADTFKALVRKKELMEVRKLIQLNKSLELRAGEITGALVASGILINACDIDMATYEPTGNMPSVNEVMWLKAEKNVRNQMLMYVTDRQTLAVQYQKKYWDTKYDYERILANFLEIKNTHFENGVFGELEKKDQWENCERVKELKFQIAERRAGYEPEECGANGNKKGDHELHYCGVCYACEHEERLNDIEIRFDNMYKGYHELSKTAYERTKEIIGPDRLRWKAPSRVPRRSDSARTQALDAAVLYMWEDQSDFSYFDL
ncbi:hypothetical protein GGS21DRAFT_514607 [Xylaria nigripes]|nr:hypothetical protein GGS21DRAFT_514607 [Xylaria nigripes]